MLSRENILSKVIGLNLATNSSPDGKRHPFLKPDKARKRYSGQRDKASDKNKKASLKNEAKILENFAGFLEFFGVANQLQLVDNLMNVAVHDISKVV